MKISKKTIKEVAELARLDLVGRDADIYADQLSNIFEYIEQLKEVDVSVLGPTAQVTGLENIMRSDVVRDCEVGTRNNALNQAILEKKQIKVPRILK